MKHMTFVLMLLLLSYGGKGQQKNGIKLQKQELIFPLQKLHVHGSSIVELPSGDLLVAWFEGSGERTADDVRIMGAKFSQRNKTWGKPYELADTPGIPDCNPVLFLHNNELFLVWIAVQANKWENSILRVRKSQSFEAEQVAWNWQDNIFLKPDSNFEKEVKDRFKELPNLHRGWAEYAPEYDDLIVQASGDLLKRSIGWMTRIKPLVIGTGRILLPVYSDGLNMSMIAYSDDHGKQWKSSLPIVGRGNIQPALVENSQGEILAFMRDSGDAPSKLQFSKSTDQGLSWTANVELDIPSTASVEVLQVEKNNWFLLVNDLEEGRAQLSLYQSKDEGITWLSKGIVVADKEKKGRFSYPAMILGKEGQIHITYSHHQGNDMKSIAYVCIDTKTWSSH